MPIQVPFEESEYTKPFANHFPHNTAELIGDWFTSDTFLNEQFSAYPAILDWYQALPLPPYILAIQHPTYFPLALPTPVGPVYNAWLDQIHPLVFHLNNLISQRCIYPDDLWDLLLFSSELETSNLYHHLYVQAGNAPESLDTLLTAAVLYRIGHTLPTLD